MSLPDQPIQGTGTHSYVRQRGLAALSNQQWPLLSEIRKLRELDPLSLSQKQPCRMDCAAQRGIHLLASAGRPQSPEPTSSSDPGRSGSSKAGSSYPLHRNPFEHSAAQPQAEFPAQMHQACGIPIHSSSRDTKKCYSSISCIARHLPRDVSGLFTSR